MKWVATIVSVALLIGVGTDFVIGQDLIPVPENATDKDRLQWRRMVIRQLSKAVSDSYVASKLSIDSEWKSGAIDRLAREKQLSALNESTAQTRRGIREANDDELVDLAGQILGGGMADPFAARTLFAFIHIPHLHAGAKIHVSVLGG